MKIPAHDLNLFLAFVTFVESPNIVVAAERLNVSQPQLSKLLRQLEESSSQSILQFEGRKKIPTPFGQQLFMVLKKWLSSLQNDLNELAIEQGDSTKALVRIGGRKEFLERLVVHLDFDGQLEFMPMPGADIAHALKKREIDVGISQRDIDSQELVRKPFTRDQQHIVVPTGYRLNAATPLTALKQLIELPYLSYGSSDSINELLNHYGIEKRLRISRAFPSWIAVVEACRKGRGWAVCPTPFLGNRTSLQVIDVPESAIPASNFYLYYPKRLSKYDWFQTLVKQFKPAMQS